jgi:hypothetical protein
MFPEYRRRMGLTDVSSLLRFDKNQPRIPSKAELDSTPQPVTAAGQKAKEQAQARDAAKALPKGGPGGKPDPAQITPGDVAAAPGKAVSAAGKLVPDAVKNAQIPSWLLPGPPGQKVGDVSRGMADGLNPLPVDTAEDATEGDQLAAMGMGMLPLPGLKALGKAFRRGGKGVANAAEAAGKALPAPHGSKARQQGVLEHDFDDVLADKAHPEPPVPPAPPKEDYGPLLGIDSPQGAPSAPSPVPVPPAGKKGWLGRANDYLQGEMVDSYFDPQTQRWVNQRGLIPKAERYLGLPSRVAGLGAAALTGAGVAAGIPTALHYLTRKGGLDARDTPRDATTPEGKAAQEEFRKRQEREQMEGPNGREAVGERNQKRVQEGGGLVPGNDELSKVLQRFEDNAIKNAGTNYNKAAMDRVKDKISKGIPLTQRENERLKEVMQGAGEGK